MIIGRHDPRFEEIFKRIFDINSGEEPDDSGVAPADFPTQHKYSDFMEFHLWPYSWNTLDMSFVNTWLQCASPPLFLCSVCKY